MTGRPIAAIPAETLVVETGSATDPGGRAENQDVVSVVALVPVAPVALAPVPEPAYLLAVADGMGGHPDGDVASQLAIKTLEERIQAEPVADPALALKQAFRKANTAIYERGETSGSVGMGTTLTAAILRGKYATIASIGDSRAYLVRANAVTQITRDHSLVADEIERGALQPAKARTNPRRNILTHALGSEPRLDTRVPGIYELTLLPGDRLLLCTDGFFDVLTDQDYTSILLAHAPAAAALQLIALANARGATDNLSAVVAEATPTRIPSAPPVAAAGPRANVASIAILVVLVLMVLVAIILVMTGLVTP